MKNRIKVSISIIVFTGILFGIHATRTTHPDHIVRVGYLSILTGAPHYIALDQELYSKANIDIETTQFQSSNQLYNAVAAGDIDIAPELSALPALINHIKDPSKVKIFTTTKISTERPFDQLVVKEDSEIFELKDLENTKIGVFPGSTASKFVQNYLTKNGVDVSTIELIKLPPQNQLQALEADSIDALYAYEPNLSFALIKNNARTVGTPIYSSYLEDNPLGAGIVSENFIVQHPKLARKVVGVYDRTFDYLTTNDKEVRQIMMREMKLDPEVAEKMNFMYHTKSTELDMEQFQKLIDILLDLNELPSQPDLSTLFFE